MHQCRLNHAQILCISRIPFANIRMKARVQSHRFTEMLHVLVRNSKLSTCIKLLVKLSGSGGVNHFNVTLQIHGNTQQNFAHLGFSFVANHGIAFYMYPQLLICVYSQNIWFRYIESHSCSRWLSLSAKSSPELVQYPFLNIVTTTGMWTMYCRHIHNYLHS